MHLRFSFAILSQENVQHYPIFGNKENGAGPFTLLSEFHWTQSVILGADFCSFPSALYIPLFKGQEYLEPENRNLVFSARDLVFNHIRKPIKIHGHLSRCIDNSQLLSPTHLRSV